MTYNFDPDDWLAARLAGLEDRRRRGDLTLEEYQLARADLERRYEEMVERLDGTYQIPPSAHRDGPPRDS